MKHLSVGGCVVILLSLGLTWAVPLSKPADEPLENGRVVASPRIARFSVLDFHKRSAFPAIPIPKLPKPDVPEVPVAPAPRPVEPPAAPAPKPAEPPVAPKPAQVPPAAGKPVTPSPKDSSEPDNGGPAPGEGPETLCKRSGGGPCDVDDPNVVTGLFNKGRQTQKNLDNALAGNKIVGADRDAVIQADNMVDDSHIEDRYVVDIGAPYDAQAVKEMPGPVSSAPYIERFGISADTKNGRWTCTKIRSKKQDLVPGADAEELGDIMTTYEDARSGVMVIKQTWSQEDQLAVGAANRKPPITMKDPPALRPFSPLTAMLKHSWNKATETAGADAKPLEYIFQDKIVPATKNGENQDKYPDTRNLMDQAATDMGGWDHWQGMVEVRRLSGDTMETHAYSVLSGSIHVDRVLKFLRDYRDDLGNINVDYLVLIKNGDEYDLGIVMTKPTTSIPGSPMYD
ncbi:hypothetical protein BT63DRAFT_415633 [Microthyrium microscopicum]|uniref:Uncharacterized protein n=1 Tax=Microthyrium microscopicum TaxID=703497 RepID=A0A6A6U4Y0_9PEZI|nr:hypothetical protein BT63DRAFT_415633 [Microthyrium microscopicum]